MLYLVDRGRELRVKAMPGDRRRDGGLLHLGKRGMKVVWIRRGGKEDEEKNLDWRCVFRVRKTDLRDSLMNSV